MARDRALANGSALRGTRSGDWVAKAVNSAYKYMCVYPHLRCTACIHDAIRGCFVQFVLF